MTEHGAALGQTSGEAAIGTVRRAGRDGVLDRIPVRPDYLGAGRHLEVGLRELEGVDLDRGGRTRTFPPGPQGQGQPCRSHRALRGTLSSAYVRRMASRGSVREGREEEGWKGGKTEGRKDGRTER